MSKIKLTKGYKTEVDEIGFDYLNQWKWCYSNRYAARSMWVKERKRYIRIFLHKLVIARMFPNSVPEGFTQGDHINGNKLDNRRSNLRLASSRQNNQNSSKRPNTTSQYKGVSLYKAKDRTASWRSCITINGKLILIGHFKTERTAAMAYDLWAKDIFGEFAKLNFR